MSAPVGADKNRNSALLVAGELIRQGSAWVSAEGNSMAPTLRPRDRILLRRVDPAQIRRGQVVAVVGSRTAVLHRVRRVRGNTVWTGGDNMAADDRPVSHQDIVGIAVVVDRGRARIALSHTLEFGVLAYARGLHIRAHLWLLKALRGLAQSARVRV